MKEIIKIFFPKSFEEKYIHIGYSYPGVPKGWKNIVKKTIIDIEKIMWPQWYLPFCIKRLIHYLAKGNSVIYIKSDYFNNIRSKLTNDQIILDIKEKFASLRIYGYFGPEIDDIIKNAENECNTHCENCSSTNNVKIVTENRWYLNLCENCRK